MHERTREDERRIGQAISDGQDAADCAGKNVGQACAECVNVQGEAPTPNETYNTIAGAA